MGLAASQGYMDIVELLLLAVREDGNEDSKEDLMKETVRRCEDGTSLRGPVIIQA